MNTSRFGTLISTLTVIATLWPSGAHAQLPTDSDLDELRALLNTKIVVASKSPEQLSDAPGIVSVITREEMRRFGGTTLLDVLVRVPGLTAATGYLFDRSMIAARGDVIRNATTSRHTLVLLDGRPVREVQEGGIKSEFYESFPVAAIERIEVIKGPGSVLYGSEAYSAVINIVTQTPHEDRATVTAAIGGGGAYNTTATATAAGDDWSLLLAARRGVKEAWPVAYSWSSEPNGPSTVTGRRIFPHETNGTFLNARIKGLTLAGAFSELQTGYALPDAAGIPATGLVPVIGENLWRAGTFDATYAFDVSPRWKMSASLTHNHSWLDVVSGTFPNVKRDSYEVLGEVTSFVQVSDRTKLTFGGLYSHAQGTEIFKTLNVAISSGSRDSYAQYAQLDHKVTDWLKGIAGFQVLEVRGQSPTVVPRAGLILYPASDFNVKVLYGEAYRAPYINELFISHPGLVGNSKLTPERVRSIEAGVSYRGDSIEVGASYFRNRQTDVIGYDFTPESPDRPQYLNVGRATIQGVELESKYFLTRSLFLSGSLLTQGADVPTGISDVGAKAGISYSSDAGSMSLFESYQGSVPAAVYNPQSSNARPGAYGLLFARATLDLNRAFNLQTGPRFEAYVQGDNVLDKEIWLPNAGNPWPDALPFNKGRAVYFGVKASFSR